jgi:hypothetical protein
MESTFNSRAAFAGHAQNFSKDAFKERILRVLAERRRR